jgi:hypothetical protein
MGGVQPDVRMLTVSLALSLPSELDFPERLASLVPEATMLDLPYFSKLVGNLGGSPGY